MNHRTHFDLQPWLMNPVLSIEIDWSTDQREQSRYRKKSAVSYLLQNCINLQMRSGGIILLLQFLTREAQKLYNPSEVYLPVIGFCKTDSVR